jgi:hypothetical protein
LYVKDVGIVAVRMLLAEGRAAKVYQVAPGGVHSVHGMGCMLDSNWGPRIAPVLGTLTENIAQNNLKLLELAPITAGTSRTDNVFAFDTAHEDTVMRTYRGVDAKDQLLYVLVDFGIASAPSAPPAAPPAASTAGH